MQLHHFALQRHHEQLHQQGHFFFGAAPVLAGEGEQGQIFHAFFGAIADRRTYRLDPAPMAFDARHEATLGPAAVAVHDDGDVFGDGARLGNFAC